MPQWYKVMLAAKDWGVPPYQVMEGVSKVTWFYRWVFVENLIDDKNKMDARLRK